MLARLFPIPLLCWDGLVSDPGCAPVHAEPAVVMAGRHEH